MICNSSQPIQVDEKLITEDDLNEDSQSKIRETFVPEEENTVEQI